MSARHGDTMSRSARLDRILAELVGQVPRSRPPRWCPSTACRWPRHSPPDMDEDRVAAMSAALLSLGERAAEGLGRGELSQVYVEGEHGTVFLISADDEAVLVAVAAKGAKVGLMLFEVRRAAAALAETMRHVLVAAVDDVDDADEPVRGPAPSLSSSRRTARRSCVTPPYVLPSQAISTFGSICRKRSSTASGPMSAEQTDQTAPRLTQGEERGLLAHGTFGRKAPTRSPGWTPIALAFAPATPPGVAARASRSPAARPWTCIASSRNTIAG